MILLVSFAGEVLKLALPFPVPGSIYGMLLLFIALCTGVIRLEHVRETGLFLVEIMPILFVSAGVGLMDSWGDLRKILLIMLVTTVIVMVVSGYATQFIMHHKTNKKQPKD